MTVWLRVTEFKPEYLVNKALCLFPAACGGVSCIENIPTEAVMYLDRTMFFVNAGLKLYLDKI